VKPWDVDVEILRRTQEHLVLLVRPSLLRTNDCLFLKIK
jgi:hypothetical protein